MNAIHERGARLMGWNLEDVDKPFVARLQASSWRSPGINASAPDCQRIRRMLAYGHSDFYPH